MATFDCTIIGVAMLLFFKAETHEVPGQYVVDVVNATADILRYAKAISGADMPVMINAPTWYSDFLNAWVNVKVHAMTWINTLDPVMTSTINSIVAFNETVTDDIGTALLDIDKLIANPNDDGAKKNLQSTLSDILKLTGRTPAKLASFENLLATFQSDIAADKATLSGAVTSAINQVGVDNNKIEELNKDIKRLRDAIDGYNRLLTLEDISKKAGIAIAVVGVVIAFGSAGVGGVLIGVGVAMIAGGIIGKIYTDQAIANAYADIVKDQASIGDLNTQIGILTSLNAQVTKLVELNTNAQSAAAKIKTFWTEFANDVATFLASVKDTQSDVDYNKAKQDMTAALVKWQALQTLLAPLESLTFDTDSNPVVLPKAA